MRSSPIPSTMQSNPRRRIDVLFIPSSLKTLEANKESSLSRVKYILSLARVTIIGPPHSGQKYLLTHSTVAAAEISVDNTSRMVIKTRLTQASYRPCLKSGFRGRPTRSRAPFRSFLWPCVCAETAKFVQSFETFLRRGRASAPRLPVLKALNFKGECSILDNP